MRETSIPTSRIPRLVTAALTAVVIVLVAAAVVMWAHYGTAVFYEIILAGLATCF
jgi:hypothetical protein